MQRKLSKYLIELRQNANRWERIDINGDEDASFGAKYLKKFIFFLISIVFTYKLNEGFPHFFVDFSSKTLAIIVGLFMTAIIFSFNKFYEPIKKEEQEKADATEKLNDTQDFNYAKQFAYITSYNVVLCLFVLAALSLNTLFENSMSINLHQYDFNFKNIDINSVLLFFKLSFIALQRFFILYWMLRILFSTLFSVSSMVKFMTTKLNRNND
jgi:hypothetical protein